MRTALALSMIAASLTTPWEAPSVASTYHDDTTKGTKRKRHGKVAERRAKNKAARAARKKGRR